MILPAVCFSFCLAFFQDEMLIPGRAQGSHGEVRIKHFTSFFGTANFPLELGSVGSA